MAMGRNGLRGHPGGQPGGCRKPRTGGLGLLRRLFYTYRYLRRSAILGDALPVGMLRAYNNTESWPARSIGENRRAGALGG